MTYSKDEKKAFCENRTKDLLQAIEDGIKRIVSSDDWKAWLNLNSKLWKYSFYNQVLIASQRPDATRVAGFNTWKALGRSVKKGEKGIYILAPIFKKEVDKLTGLEVKKLSFFKTVAVFDAAQTDGKELPKLDIWLKGSAPEDLFDKVKAFAAVQGYSLSFEALSPELGGYVQNKSITINTKKDSLAQLHTLIHELSHDLLGHCGDTKLSRNEKELEAETAAFVICKQLGIDADEFSFNYLAGWSGSGTLQAALKTAGIKAQRVAKLVLEGLGVGQVEEQEVAVAA